MPIDAWEWKRDTEGILVFFVGMAVGMIILHPPGVAWLARDHIFGSTILAGWAICSFGLSLLRPGWAVVGVGLSGPAFLMAGMAITQDPGNLWPIALVISLAVTGAPAVVGAVAGGFLKRFITRKILLATILVAAGVFIAVRPAVLTRRQVLMQTSINEAYSLSALSRLTAIVEAQREYQSQDPDGQYACNFDELNQTFERRERRSRSDTGWADGYIFWMGCRSGPPSTFRMNVTPENRRNGVGQATGLTVYCVDPTGQFLSVPAVPRRNCWENGEPLSSP